jgi:lysophospholipase L1-like esterase
MSAAWWFALLAAACGHGSSDGGGGNLSSGHPGVDGSAAPGFDASDVAMDASTTPGLSDAAQDAVATGEQDAVAMGAPDATPAGPPAVRYIGRFDVSKPDAPSAEWSGSAMEARFSGTQVSARLGGSNNYFDVVLDGVVQPVIKTSGQASNAIATGLAAGTHDVLVFRRDEAFDNPATFTGFDFGSGALLAPPPAPARRIEIVGDSISAGYGDECPNASTGFSAATENEYIAYGPVTARALGADVHVIAWSGKGLYRNLDGSMTETMPILWQRTIPTDASSRWDPSRWIPNVVVINLGTNDYNAGGGDPSASFQSTYLQFVEQLEAAYPGVFILGAVGPMLGGSSYAAVKKAISNVVSMRSDAGDARVRLVEFPTQDCGSDGSGCGCDSHPNAAEHQKMATVLQAAMRSALGW